MSAFEVFPRSRAPPDTPCGLDPSSVPESCSPSAVTWGSNPHIGHTDERFAVEQMAAAKVQIHARMRPSIFDRVSKAGNIERNVVASYMAAEELREIQMHVEHLRARSAPKMRFGHTIIPGPSKGVQVRSPADSFSQARSCGCVRVLLQWAQSFAGSLSALASRLPTRRFRCRELCRNSGLPCATAPNTSRRSERFVPCSTVVAGAPQIQHVELAAAAFPIMWSPQPS